MHEPPTVPQSPDPSDVSSQVSSETGSASSESGRGRWKSFRFAVKMIEVRLRFIAVFVAIGLVIGYWETIRNHWDKWTRPPATAAIAGNEEYFCPMDPQVVRDSLDPGGKLPWCPICNMPLSKRKKGAPVELPPGALSRAQFSPERIQYAGLRTSEVSFQPLQQEIRAVGDVVYDETRQSQIVARFSGYVEKLYVDRTFQTVSQGDPLAEIYSPDLSNAVQELLIARKNDSYQPLIQAAHEKLRLLGVSEQEIDEILRRGKAESRLVIRAPRAGHVIGKNLVDGSRIEIGMTLFEIADLSTVWIEADVFEKDIALVREGQQVEAVVDAYSGRVFPGRVSLVHPHLERETRTNRVRFELENRDLALRPGMYATVRIVSPVAELEPFRTHIAERRRRPAADDLAALAAWQRICPVMAVPLDSMGGPVSTTVAGETVLICCRGCDNRLQKSPEQYMAKIAPPPEDAVMVVPQDAVIDTGSRKIVYVEREPGMFDGIEVVLGRRSGAFYPVLSGLAAGDRVATAGSFLIDAETRLNPAASATYFGASGGADSRPAAVQP